LLSIPACFNEAFKVVSRDCKSFTLGAQGFKCLAIVENFKIFVCCACWLISLLLGDVRWSLVLYLKGALGSLQSLRCQKRCLLKGKSQHDVFKVLGLRVDSLFFLARGMSFCSVGAFLLIMI
jgi:hypothetical protein